jgi:hypothetical protein
MLMRHVALVNESGQKISARLLTKVGAALQKQVARDFGPIWGVSASVAAFTTLDDVPVDYWPVILVEDVQYAAGVHMDDQGQPYALVEVGDNWSLTASHETLEMLADPYGNRLIAGPSPKAGQGRVQFLVEVCDPSESGDYSYTVNGVRVSDFYTPRFFDPQRASGVRYSFSGAIEAPRQVLRGGYLSWHNPLDDHWYQQRYFSQASEIIDLGQLTGGADLRSSLRSMIDSSTPGARPHVRALSSERQAAMNAAYGEAEQATAARARSLRTTIQSLTRPAKRRG